MDEIALAQLAIKGNQTALVKLLALYRPSMYRVAFSYMRNVHDANDAVQEVTYICLKQAHQVQSPVFFKTWLVRIVINTCLSMKKKQNRIIVSDNIMERSSEMSQLFEINDAIMQLPVEQQELIHLKYFQDLKNSEIATLKNIPEGTVKSRLHKTIKKLKYLLREEGMS